KEKSGGVPGCGLADARAEGARGGCRQNGMRAGVAYCQGPLGRREAKGVERGVEETNQVAPTFYQWDPERTRCIRSRRERVRVVGEGDHLHNGIGERGLRHAVVYQAGDARSGSITRGRSALLCNERW